MDLVDLIRDVSKKLNWYLTHLFLNHFKSNHIESHLVNPIEIKIWHYYYYLLNANNKKMLCKIRHSMAPHGPRFSSFYFYIIFELLTPRKKDMIN
jgi:hypothetical protein